MTTFSSESRAILKTSMGDVTLEFLTDKAPRTCEHFVKLARRGFYDGLTFHRVVKGFMAQGGCPKGDGTGGPGFTVRAEFNDTPHVRGVVSMARGNDPHSAGSQFFVVDGEARYLDSRYTAFARVVDGLPVLDRIVAVPVEENRYREASKPRDPIFINSIVLEGIEFDAEDTEPPKGAGAQGAPSAPSAEAQPEQAEESAPGSGDAPADGGDAEAEGDEDKPAPGGGARRPRRKSRNRRKNDKS
jgi:peptidyl-prolyl cis-trans isomerase B (cyclophilin B)